MSIHNGFFKWNDKRSDIVAGMKIPEQWWSRPYEYAWALQFTKPSIVVADMGCGWMYRPFKDALAATCGYVYAVDADKRLLNQTPKDNMQFVIGSFANKIPEIADESIDTLFCISVLEDLNEMVQDAMLEFSRILKPKGRMALTFDVQYDMDKPLGQYPGVKLDKLLLALDENGLVIDGELVMDKTNAVYHEGFNLCCLHMVVKHA